MNRYLKSQAMILQSSIVPKSLVIGGGLALAGMGGYYLYDSRSAVHEYVLCPLIRHLTTAEDGHKLGIFFMKHGIAPKAPNEEPDKILEVKVFGRTLGTPIGLAAGLDKDGEAVDALLDTGFSFVEIGSVTPEPQPGNPKPRFFRLPKDEAVINRYGFNSAGHYDVVGRLRVRLFRYLKKLGISAGDDSVPLSFRKNKLLGINLGKNKFGDEITDYVKGVDRLGPYADVLIINVSSPNTPGLRDLQSESKLTNLLERVVKERDSLGKNLMGTKPPVMVKIAPDLTEPEIESIASSVKAAKVDGVIVSNTTIQRPTATLRTKDQALVNQNGGLSGKPLKPLSLKALRLLRKYTKDSNVVLVGCGGISSGKDALEFGKAGATFVELYTAFAYKGPGLPYKIQKELAQELKKEGKSWQEIIGIDDN